MKLSYGGPAATSSSSDMTNAPIDAGPWGKRLGVGITIPPVRPVLAAVATIELEEVITVVGHDGPLGRLRVAEQVLVRESAKFSSFADPFDIRLRPRSCSATTAEIIRRRASCDRHMLS